MLQGQVGHHRLPDVRICTDLPVGMFLSRNRYTAVYASQVGTQNVHAYPYHCLYLPSFARGGFASAFGGVGGVPFLGCALGFGLGVVGTVASA